MRRGFTMLELILVGLVASGLIATIYLAYQREQHRIRRGTCRSELNVLGTAFFQYCQDNDNKFPARPNVPPELTNWNARIKPYVNPWLGPTHECPENGPLPDLATSRTDYFFNLRLYGHDSAALKHPANTILLAEGERASEDYACWDFSRCVGQTANGPVGAVPESARTRHLDGENIAFTDGHVKWFARERQQPQPHPALGFSFALK